jgi:hypothetical protein
MDVLSRRRAALLLLAGFAALAADQASAQAHLPPPKWEDPIGPTAAPDVWLRRLVGKYKFDGVATAGGDCFNSQGATMCAGIKGKGDCIAVGTGPGVQCIFNATWQDIWSPRGDPILISFLDPSMALFGLDPGYSAINMLLVNDKGLPRGGLGFNKGNVATFKTCLYQGGDCGQIIRIEARSDANIVYMWIDSNVQLTLRRDPPKGEGDAPAK